MQFIESLLEPVPDDGAGGLQVPRRGGAELAGGQHLLHLRERQRVPQVLLVGHDEHRHPLVLRDPRDFVQFRLGFLHPLHVHRIHHEDDAVGAAGVGLPQGPQLLLAPDVPEVESDRLVVPQSHLDLLRVEPFGGDGVDELVELQPVEDGGLAGAVQTQDHDVEALEGGQAGQDRRLLRQPIPHRRGGAPRRAGAPVTRRCLLAALRLLVSVLS